MLNKFKAVAKKGADIDAQVRLSWVFGLLPVTSTGEPMCLHCLQTAPLLPLLGTSLTACRVWAYDQVVGTAEDAVKQIEVLLECYTRAILDLDDVRPKKTDPSYAEVTVRAGFLNTSVPLGGR